MKYLALLRGINVGGNNIIKKDELKACFEKAGFTNILTYIQSGNILFESNEKDINKITNQIEKELANKLKNKIPTLVLSEKNYRNAIKSAPENWGRKSDKRYNALFVINGQTPQELLSTLPEMKNKDEKLHAGIAVLFWETSKEHRTKSFYSTGLVKHPIYKKVTIRNSNTSFKLLELLQKAGGS